MSHSKKLKNVHTSSRSSLLSDFDYNLILWRDFRKASWKSVQ